MILKEIKLGDVCLIRRGTTITQKEATDGDIPVVAGGLKPTYYHKQANRFNTTITISGSGANAGFVNLWEQPIFASDCSTVEVKDSKLDIQYVYYFLLSKQEYIYKNLRSGAAQPHVYGKNIAELLINIPPLATQQKIVAKLDAIFAEIDVATAAAEANTRNAEALFLSYLNKIYNEYFINSKKYKLGEVCTFQGGSQPAKSFFKYKLDEENIRLIQIRDYKSDKNLVYIPKKMAKRFCDDTDVMIGRYGPPVFQILRGITGSYNVALMKAIPNQKLLTKDYLFYFLKNPLIQDYVISLSNRAAGQSGLNKETIEPYEIYLPSLVEQNTSVIKIELCFTHCQKIITSSQLKFKNMSLLKQSILTQAFNGELVKE